MGNHYAVLERESLLHLTGPDARQFLQGQVTCNALEVGPESARPGAYCTPQGRVVCDFLLCELAEQHMALRLRRGLRHSSAEVFGKYIIFSKAELDANDDSWSIFGCWGDTVDSVLAGIFGSVPVDRFATVQGEGFCLVRLDDAPPRYECYIQSSAQPGMPGQLESALQKVDEQLWQSMEIDAGIARIEAATVGEFVPQMLNYDLTGHISFTKGCYTGQEVVARLHYRGTPKRRLYRANLPQGCDAQPGEPLFGDGDQSIGNLVNLAETADEKTRGLAIATVSKLEEGLHLGSPDGPLLDLLDLPYSLDSE